MTIHIVNRVIHPTNLVALTFDDGPNPPATEEILEILSSKSVRGNFFILGKWAQRYPRTVRRMVSSKHVIGNHGYSHYYGVGDFEKAEILISHLTGQRSKFIRAPYFASEAYSSLSSVFLKNVQIVHADIVPNDYSLTEEQLLTALFGSDGVQGGSIVSLHDGSEDPDASNRLLRPLNLIQTLPEILYRLNSLGLQVAGLDEMLS